MKTKNILKIILLISCCMTKVLAFETVKDPWSFAELEQQYQKMVEQYKVLTDQLTTLKEQAKTIGKEIETLVNTTYNWGGIQNDLNSLGEIIGQMQGIAYSAEDLDKTFSETFPGYKSKEDYIKQYEAIINKSQETLNGVLDSVNKAAAQFAKAETRLEDLKNDSAKAVGETSAIQAASQIAIEEVEQLQLLRQTIMAQTNAQTVYYAAELQKEASAKLELDEILDKGKDQKVDAKLNNHPLSNPNF